jgi:hypothetical protein
VRYSFVLHGPFIHEIPSSTLRSIYFIEPGHQLHSSCPCKPEHQGTYYSHHSIKEEES